MKYVFMPFTATRADCTTSQLGYGDYLSDNGYTCTNSMFVPDAYYKWGYLTINDMPDRPDKLPYVPGDEIYFVLGRDLDKFIETTLRAGGNNFKFVEKSEFYEWALYNGSQRLKEIANNYLKNTKCNYMQYKNLNVGDVFKLINGKFLYIKISPMINRCCRWEAVVLNGDKKGCIITFTPETNVEIVRNVVITGHDKGDLSEAYKNQCKLDFMTYGGVPMDIVKYTKSDCETTWRLYKEMGNTIKKVIFNDPATIVFWGDGSKTVVKCQKGETFDPEKGLAMAISKKMLGNDHKYYETFAKYVGRYNKKKFNKALKDAKKIPPDEITYNGETYVLKK